MNKQLNFSILAALVVANLSCSIGYASQGNSGEKESDNFRIYVNTQPRSLYQIALLSDISVTELRKLNKGSFDNRDTVNVGENIVLPVTSKLLSENKKITDNDDKQSTLPILGSDQTLSVNSDENRTIETHVANALQTVATQNWKDLNSDKIKRRIQTEAESRVESYARQQVRAQLIDPVQQAAQALLGKFGTAQVNLAVSDNGSFKGSSLKLFSPWYDSERMLTFSQVSVGDYDGRTIGNFGLGQRWDVANNTLMLGYNAFYDHDFSRSHTRLGIGVEAWADYLKFSANYYSPLSDWKDSKDFEDYLERAARGFDVRMQGYLPSYPHLGGSLIYEQYFGDEVALFGKDNRQKDPRAVSIGIDYTPVPLFTVKGQYKQGQGGKSASVVDLTMNYRMGVPLNEQLDPEKVTAARTLKGSRYDMVDRNNNIILEYKQQKPSLSLSLNMTEADERGYITLKMNGVKIGDPKNYSTDYFLYSDRTTSPAQAVMDDFARMSLCRSNSQDTNYRFRPVIVPPGDQFPPECGADGLPILRTVASEVEPQKGQVASKDNQGSRDIGGWEILAPQFDVITNDNEYNFMIVIKDKNGNPVKSNPMNLFIHSDRKSVINQVSFQPMASTGEKNATNPVVNANGKDIFTLRVHLERPNFEGKYIPFNDEIKYQNDLSLNESLREANKDNPYQSPGNSLEGKPTVWWSIKGEGLDYKGNEKLLPKDAVQFEVLNQGEPIPPLVCSDSAGCVRLSVIKNSDLGVGIVEENASIYYEVNITSTRRGTFEIGAAFPPPKNYPKDHPFTKPFYLPSTPLKISFDGSGPKPPEPPPEPADKKMTAIAIYHWGTVSDDWELIDFDKNTGIFNESTSIKVGDFYKVEALNAASEVIPAKDLTSVNWSVFDNNKECGASPIVTISKDAPVTLQSNNSSAGVIPESAMQLTIPVTNNELKGLGAACGTQGFKLKVSVNQ